MKRTRLAIDSVAQPRRINACLYPAASDLPKRIAVVAHPYGPLGGTQDDSVVRYIATLLQTLDIAVLTFDFTRPTSWTGMSERMQYIEVVAYATGRFSSAQMVYCCGYSYGTLCLPSEEEVFEHSKRRMHTSYIAISPLLWPISTALTMSLADRYKHVRTARHLAIWGANDTFTSSKRLQKAWNSGITVPNTDHFWRDTDSLESLKSSVMSFICSYEIGD